MNIVLAPFRFLARLIRALAVGVLSYWSMAILSLGLATALWVFVTDAENPPRSDVFPTKIPVEAVNIPDQLAIAGGNSSYSVSIRISARENTWNDLTVDDFQATADFANLPQGSVNAPVRVSVREGLRDEVNVLEVSPDTIPARLEVIVSRVVPVQVNITGQPPVAFKAGEPDVQPKQATVSGPQNLVNQVAQVEADVNLSGITLDLSRSFTLTARTSSGNTIDGVRLDPDTAVVSVKIEQEVGTRLLVVRPSITGAVADGYQVLDVTAQPAAIAGFGTQEALQALDFVPTENIDITGATSDVERNVLVQLPPDVSAPGQASVIVRVRIAPVPGETSLGVVPRIDNLDPGLSVTLNTPTITVTMAGDLPVLNALKPRDVNVTIDASDLGPGVYSLVPEITVPPNVTVTEHRPTEVTFTITRR